MEYNTFEELYKDNREIFDLEFKMRLFDVLNKILSKIEDFQEKEHKEIDAGASYRENQPHRDNILNLEKIYKPLYNYINSVSIPLMECHKKTYIDEAVANFIEFAFPQITEEEISKMRGKPHWHENLIKESKMAYEVSQMLRILIKNVYTLGATNIDKEDKDVYNEKEYPFDEKTFAEKREDKLRHLTYYGKDTILSKMAISLYNMGSRNGYEEAVKKGLKGAEINNYADDCGMKVVTDFIKDIFTT